jgi:predicted  nucleic acid-binding Zn-ribbon protein
MTPEERFERIEQKIEFIVNQQAQFAADLQEERRERREREALMQQQIDTIQGHVNTLALAMVDLSVKMERLTEAQARSDEKIARLAEGMQKLEEKSAETEERLNVFITFVERYLSQRDNGRQSAQE